MKKINSHIVPPAAPRRLARQAAIVALAVALSACLQERDRSEEIAALIEQTAKERLDRYQQVRMERCREDLLEEATRLTDSILIAEARLEQSRADRPPTPHKPERPETRRLDDSIPIKPLLPEEDTIRILPDTTGEGE